MPEFEGRRGISVSGENLQKISNLESIQNNKNNVKNEEDEIMISDYRVEDCTIFDKTSGQGKHIKGKRTILEWTDGTVTIVNVPMLSSTLITVLRLH